MTQSDSPRRWTIAAILALGLLAPSALELVAQATPPTSAPAEWGAVSINMEEIPYPHPVSFLDLELYGQGVRLAYMDVAPAGSANGRTVVLLHGASYYAWYWAETIGALRNEGYRVLAVDLLGWGKSSKPILPYTLHLHASTVAALLDDRGVERAAIVGHSMGGMLSSRIAFMYPARTTHLVMVNAIGLTDPRAGRGWQEPSPTIGTVDLDQAYRSLLQQEVNRVVEWRPEYLEHVRIRYGWRLSSEWPRLAYVQALNNSSRAIDTVVHDWPHIQTPALVIGGEIDGPNFPALARNTAETLGNAELVLFPNVGHNPHLEAPELFIPALLEFLGR